MVLNNEKGFSLFEMVLTLFIIVLFGWLSSATVLTQVSTYHDIAQRKSSIHEVSQVMNRMTREFEMLESADITSVSSTQIDFDDEDNNSTNYRTATVSGKLILYRGSDILIDDVQSFTLTYYDSSGSTTTTAADVRRIQVEIISKEKNNEGSIVLTTSVTPKEFVGYGNIEI